MKINNLEIECFLSKPHQYHQRPYHLRSIILNFECMSIENCIVYNYAYDNNLNLEKRHTKYFIEISYLTLDKGFVESVKLKNYLIDVLKNQILLNNEKYCDLSYLKSEIKVEKLHNKLKKIKINKL